MGDSLNWPTEVTYSIELTDSFGDLSINDQSTSSMGGPRGAGPP